MPPPRKEPYTFDQDIDDLAAILEHTGARAVIGHSSGGYIALQAALRLPIDRLALYDAAVSIDGGFPSEWLDAAREAARAGDIARSMAITTGGINTHSLVVTASARPPRRDLPRVPADVDRPDDGRPAPDDPRRVEPDPPARRSRRDVVGDHAPTCC